MQQKLTRADKSHLSYIHIPGKKKLCILYLHGFLSSQQGKRAEAIRSCAKELGAHYLSLDYTGCGASSGTPADFRVGRCLADAADVVKHAAPGLPLLIVGHSLGGYIAFLLSERLPERVRGVLSLAPGIDGMDYIWRRWIPWYGKVLLRCGKVLGPNQRTRGYCFSYPMFKEAAPYRLLGRRVRYDGDVVVMCGDKDRLVSWRHAFGIKDSLTSERVKCCLIKGGEHRLGTPEHLQAMQQAIAAMYRRIMP
ncbi:MAG: alpha/beta hydrolase [Alphaproteobacteria bacterium]|nr:alpha/beta hydrolase [Alphaproteobacteria bacterium]